MPPPFDAVIAGSGQQRLRHHHRCNTGVELRHGPTLPTTRRFPIPSMAIRVASGATRASGDAVSQADPGDAEIVADRCRDPGQECPPVAQARALSRRSPHGHTPAPAAHTASQTPAVSALQIQGKSISRTFKSNLSIYMHQFSMLSARDRSLLITFDAGIAEVPTLKQSARNLLGTTMLRFWVPSPPADTDC
jgi:hypothetical protein